MHLTFSDQNNVSETGLKKTISKLKTFNTFVVEERAQPVSDTPLAALFSWQDDAQLAAVHEVLAAFKKPKHVILVGIGGQTLGIEAIHAVLATPDTPQLHILDTVAPHEMESVLAALRRVKKATDVAVCISSKSGTTVETLSNAEVLMGALEEQLGTAIWQQTVVIGTDKSELLQRAHKRKAKTIAMPKVVGGRYSVFTAAGLVPLGLLGHDIEALLSGVEDASSEEYRQLALENAARLFLHCKAGMRHYNFFAFDTRFVRLGKWYRQLTAESLGKELTRSGTAVKLGFVPTISTAVDLHSIGQLYFAQFPGVYTDFVSFSDDTIDYRIPAKPKIATPLAKQTQQDIAAAIYAGVVAAYQERRLPYRSTIFYERLDYSLGLFMANRMLETIALAELLDVDAFNQPNVELYKKNTKKILGLK